MNLKKHLIFIVFTLVISPVVLADRWDLGINSISLGVADVGWTVADKYQGTKLLFDTRYVITRGEATVEKEASGESLKNIINAHIQAGDADPVVDYYVLEYTYLAEQDKMDLSPGKIQPVRDQLEWGKVMFSEDHTLGINYYSELTVVRIGRTWAYKSSNSGITYGLGLNGSLGWALADSADSRYGSVSNPTTGFWNNFFIKHNGSSPSRVGIT